MKGKIFSKEFLENLELIFQRNTELRPDLNGNPFFGRPLERQKKIGSGRRKCSPKKIKKLALHRIKMVNKNRQISTRPSLTELRKHPSNLLAETF